MGEQSKISWTDSTCNFWSGCEKISAGCAHCYADERDARMLQEPIRHFGKGAPRLKSKSAVKAALALNRKPWISDVTGEAYSDFGRQEAIMRNESLHRRRVFSLSLGDWLDDAVPIEWLAEMLDTIRQCDQVTWILCSKRWENFFKRIDPLPVSDLGKWLHGWRTGEFVPANIIGLCSVENQAMADKRIPQFLTVPLACRGLSLEPLLGPVVLPERALAKGWCGCGNCQHSENAWPCPKPLPRINWLIIGGESGPKARPCNVDWIRSIVAQGQAAGVATFVKQLGAKPVETIVTYQNGMPFTGSGKTPFDGQITDKKGGDKKEWPKDLQIQEFPKL